MESSEDEAPAPPASRRPARRRGAKAPSDLPAALQPCRLRRSPWAPVLKAGVRAVEVCCGAGELCAALNQRGVAAQGLDVSISPDHDLLGPELDREIRAGVVSGALKYLHFAIPCNTFSPARFPKLRTVRFPRGLANVKEKDRRVLQYANKLTDSLLALAVFAAERGCSISVENPYCSVLWSYDGMLRLMDMNAHVNAVDYCMFGTPYKKPTKFLSVNLALPSINVRCSGLIP